jgi:hypothetical protein
MYKAFFWASLQHRALVNFVALPPRNQGHLVKGLPKRLQQRVYTMRKVVRVTGGGEVKGGNKGWFHGFKGGGGEWCLSFRRDEGDCEIERRLFDNF